MLFRNLLSFIKLKPAFALGFLLAVNSLLLGIWVAALPGIKERLGFTDGSLGLSLLLSPLGAITGVFLATRIFSKIPVGKWMLFGYIAVCVFKSIEVNSINRPMFWICLYCFGLISFLNGVSVNATVNILEQKYNRLLMSTSHAMYSLGGAVSAGLAALMFMFRIPSGIQIVVVAAIVIIIIVFIRYYLLANTDIIHSGSGLKLPSLSVLGISFICMVIFMAEGCVADWSAIYFKEVLNAPKALMSLGYAGFSVAMTIGRLNGDDLVAKTGNKNAVIAGCLMTATGFVIVVFTGSVLLSILGYIIIGLGCSSIVPVLFRTSAAIEGLSKVEGFAMVTTGGLIGFLAGPSVIGFIAEHSGLSKGLSLLIVMTVLAAAVAWRNRFLQQKKQPAVAEDFDEQIY